MCTLCNHSIFILLTAIDHTDWSYSVKMWICTLVFHQCIQVLFCLGWWFLNLECLHEYMYMLLSQSVFFPCTLFLLSLSLFVFSSLLSLLLLSTSCYLFLFSHVHHPRWRSHWFLPTSSLAAAVLPLPLLTLLYYASNGRSQEIQEEHHCCEWLLLHHVTTLNKSA